jgi:hypothetical protein
MYKKRKKKRFKLVDFGELCICDIFKYQNKWYMKWDEITGTLVQDGRKKKNFDDMKVLIEVVPKEFL